MSNLHPKQNKDSFVIVCHTQTLCCRLENTKITNVKAADASDTANVNGSNCLTLLLFLSPKKEFCLVSVLFYVDTAHGGAKKAFTLLTRTLINWKDAIADLESLYKLQYHRFCSKDDRLL